MDGLIAGQQAAAATPSIRQKLQQQISSPPASSAAEKVEAPVDEKAEVVEEAADEPQQESTTIDELVGIDPSFILEDETTRNTQFNATLYDDDDDSTKVGLDSDLIAKDSSALRLMESDSSLELARPQPVHANAKAPLLDDTSSTQSVPLSPVLRSLDGTPIKPTLKSPIQSARNSPKPPLFRSNTDYERRIAFNTLESDNVNNLQLILKTKHKAYKFTRISRTFLCGYDDHQYSETALQWAIDELMDDGDTIVCLKVLPLEGFSKKQGPYYQAENEKLLDKILEFNKHGKKISIVLEISVSQKISKKILQAITDYEPALLIVGTSGVVKKGFKNIISPKSMSKYCLQYSEVPVIVVRPNYTPVHDTKSCIHIAKHKRGHSGELNQSLDQLVLDDDGDGEEEEVVVDEGYYKTLITSFTPAGPEGENERQTRSSQRTSARPHSMIFNRGKSQPSSSTSSPVSSPALTPTISGSNITPVRSSEFVLRPTRSRGFSPVRSLSPFWRKNKNINSNNE